MSSHAMIEIYGLLHAAEMEVTISHSKVPEIEAALRETEKLLQAVQASMRIALTFKPMEEK